MDTVVISKMTSGKKRHTKGVTFRDLDLERYAIITTKVVGPTRFTLFCSKDQSMCFLLIEGPDGGANLEDVEAVMRSQKLLFTEEFKKMTKRYIDANYCVDGEHAALVVARGKEPKPGKDSWVEWHVEEPFDSRSGIEDTTGKVDYRNRKNFVFVEKDQHILTVHAATRGEEGMDYRGNPIPTSDGIWKRPLAGLGIKCDQSQKDMYAECEGVLQISADNKLHVRKMLEVHDVDFKTGNIFFEGDVDVGGSVREGFEVHSKGIVNIVNDVERAQVFGQEINVTGAILNSTCIAKGGPMMIGRAERSTLRADGDIVGTADLVGMTIHCGGALKLEGKKFIGGTIHALGGVELGWLGGKSESKTTVIIDTANCHLPSCDEQREKIEEMAAQKKKLEAALGPILADRQAAMAKLAPAQKEAVQKLLSKYEGFEFEMDVASSGVRRAVSEVAPEVKKVIKLSRGISAGVTIKIGELTYTNDDERSGEITIKLSSDGNSIVVEG